MKLLIQEIASPSLTVLTAYGCGITVASADLGGCVGLDNNTTVLPLVLLERRKIRLLNLTTIAKRDTNFRTVRLYALK